jgi:hypothetical protein
LPFTVAQRPSGAMTASRRRTNPAASRREDQRKRPDLAMTARQSVALLTIICSSLRSLPMRMLSDGVRPFVCSA